MYHFGLKSLLLGLDWGGDGVGAAVSKWHHRGNCKSLYPVSHVTAREKVKMTYSATTGGRSRIQRQHVFDQIHAFKGFHIYIHTCVCI